MTKLLLRRWRHKNVFPCFIAHVEKYALRIVILGARCWWRGWLRHCATSRKVAGSIPDGVTGIFHNTSGRTMALGLTQPLTEMSTRNISWEVRAAGAYGWQPYHLHVVIVLKSGSLKLLEPTGPVQACNGIVLLNILLHNIHTQFKETHHSSPHTLVNE